MTRKKKSLAKRVLSLALPLAAVILVGCMFFSGLRDLEKGQSEQGTAQLEAALRRAAVSCYAAEGCYPSDVEYLKRYYGVQIDTDRYLVHYRVFAENLMPEISVTGKSA